MSIGVSPFGTTREGVIAIARAAVDGGFDTLWLGDGLLEVADFPRWSGGQEAFTELAWFAGQFPETRLGIGAAVLPLRDLHWTVRQIATLDQLTEGQLVVAVAPGIWEREFVFRELDYEQRGEHFTETVTALQAALRGETYEGTHVRIPPGGRLSPRPFREGGPPLWLAGGRATFLKALRRGLPFQASRLSPAALAPWAAEWFDGGGTELHVRVRLAVDDLPPPGEEVDWQTLAGPPSFLADVIARYLELGVTDVSIVPGQDDQSSLRTVETIATAVLSNTPA